MLRTVILGPYNFVQGELVREPEDGRLEVRAGSRTFVGGLQKGNSTARLPQTGRAAVG